MIIVAYYVIYSLMFFQHEAELKILPTADRNVYRVIYKADFDWNVELSLINEKGKKMFSTKIEKTNGFLLPINMEGESSGRFTLMVSTAAYDISESFDYETLDDWLRRNLNVEFKPDRQSVTVSSNEVIMDDITLSIHNDIGDVLVSDKISASESTIYRVYDLVDAPGMKVRVYISTSKYHLINQSFDF